jgi:hypothetical protein
MGNHNITPEDLICLGSNGQCECGSNSWILLPMESSAVRGVENLILNVWSVGLVNIYK